MIILHSHSYYLINFNLSDYILTTLYKKSYKGIISQFIISYTEIYLGNTDENG